MTRKHVGFTVDDATWQSAMERLQWGEMSERLRDTVVEIAYGADISKRQKVQRRLDEVRARRDELQNKISNLGADLQRQNAQIAELERTLATLNDVEGEYSGALQVIEDIINVGARVDPEHVQVTRAAALKKVQPEEVINDLQERNPDLPTEAFRFAENDEAADWREATQN
jgi:septal ring factor EnvC (AmiA/AmiB activator)